MRNYSFKALLVTFVSFTIAFSACTSKRSTEVVNPTTLEGTWKLVGYKNNGGTLETGGTDVQENPVIEFKQGSYGGSTPQNAFAGSYTLLENNGLVMSSPSSTLASETQWGSRFLVSLTNANHFSIQKNQLQIFLKNSEGWMVLQKKE